MNGAFVVDASAAIACVVRSQADEEALDLLDNVLSGSSAIVPVLWTFEVANTLLVLLRRRIVDKEQYERARQALADLVTAMDEEGPRLALSTISLLAEKHALSVYDAVYLELALRRGLPLATRDAALNKAAKRAGVRTLLAH